MTIIKQQQDSINNNIITTTIVCSICKTSDSIVTDAESGEVICSNCGMVISDKIQDINHAERRAFSSEVMSNKGSRRTGSQKLFFTGFLHDFHIKNARKELTL